MKMIFLRVNKILYKFDIQGNSIIISQKNFFHNQMSKIGRIFVRGDQSEFDLGQLFNCLMMITVNCPFFIESKQKMEQQSKSSILDGLGKVEEASIALRFMKSQPINNLESKTKKTLRKQTLKNSTKKCTLKIALKSNSRIFLRPIIEVNDKKIFWVVRGSQKNKIPLFEPQFAISLPNDYLVAIQRRCISLYELQGCHLQLKDYNSVAINKSMMLVDVKFITYYSTNYILIFVNQKEGNKTSFKVVVLEKTNDLRLLLIKKQLIVDYQISEPMIIFDEYPGSEEKFILILGGYTENKEHQIYSAIQINLKIMVFQHLSLSKDVVKQIPFSSKISILSGKAIKFNNFWYLLITEDQRICQLSMIFNCCILQSLKLKSQDLSFEENIYFSEDSVHLGAKQNHHNIIMINKNIEFRFKPFKQVISKFSTY